jgi:serine/threonine protein kinase
MSTTTCATCGGNIPDGALACPECGVSIHASVVHDELQPGSLVGDRFRIEVTLGRGGFGVTYRATDTRMGSKVAVKELLPPGSRREQSGLIVSQHPDTRSTAISRFLLEAQTLRQVTHPSVVRVYDYFEENGTAYLVMEYLEGETLEAVLLANGPWAEQRTVDLVDEICDALEAVHSHGFLHRDLKPANVILVPERGPVLIDFGSAREANVGQTSTVTQIVTPGYAAPEQYGTRARLGPFTDVYGVGALVHVMLTGAMTPAATDRLALDELRPLMQQVPGGTTNLAAAADAALSIRVAERPQTIAEFRDLMYANVLVPELPLPPSIAPPKAVVPSKSVTRRAGNRLPWVGAAVAGVSVLVGGGYVALTNSGSGSAASQTNSVATASAKTPVRQPQAAKQTTSSVPIASTSAAPTPVDTTDPVVPAANSTLPPLASGLLFEPNQARVGLLFDASSTLSNEFAQVVRSGANAKLPIDTCDVSDGKATTSDSAKKELAAACAKRWQQTGGLVGVLAVGSSELIRALNPMLTTNVPVLFAGTREESLTHPRRWDGAFRLSPSVSQFGTAIAGELPSAGQTVFVLKRPATDAVDFGPAETAFARALSPSNLVADGSDAELTEFLGQSTKSRKVVVALGITQSEVGPIARRLAGGAKPSILIGTYEMASGSGKLECPPSVKCVFVDSGLYQTPSTIVASYRKATKKPLSAGSWAALGSQGYELLFDAFNRVSTVDRQGSRSDVHQQMIQTLSSSTFTSSIGPTAFDADGDSTVSRYVLFGYANGGWSPKPSLKNFVGY